MKKTLLSFIMFSAIGIYSTQAQITLLDTDIIGIGDDVEQAHDTIPGGITIGSGGASQTWNFSTLSADKLDTLKFRNPSAGYPGYTSFPLANIVLVQPPQDSTWMYLTKNAAGLFVDGQSQYQQGQLVTFPITTTIITFPSTMGTNYGGVWNGVLFGIDVSAYPLGLDSLKITREATVTSNIDGWGNVTTPFGTFASLRQIVYEEDVDTTWEKSSSTGMWTIISPATIAALGAFGFPVNDISYDTTRTARWWTNDPSSKFPLVEMNYEANGNVNEITWQKSSPTVSVQEQAQAVSGVMLYPNPAKNEITIETGLTNNNTIEIMDVTGKLVANHNFKSNKITLSVANLDNGVYFYNIYDAERNILHSNKFVIAK